MTPERWRQVGDVFHAALGHGKATRQPYLDGACANDPELRAEVDALLAAHEQAGEFGERPIFSSAAEMAIVAEAAVGPGAAIAAADALASAPASAVGNAGALPRRRHRFVLLVWLVAFGTVATYVSGSWPLIDGGFTLPYVGWRETRHSDVAYVTAVDPAGPAAGRIRPGDRIVSLNGSPPIGGMGTRYHRASLSPGDAYELTVVRGGEQTTERLGVIASRAELGSRFGWLLVSLVWCAVGLLIGFARPDQALARLAFASSLATGLVLFQIGVAHGGILWQPLHVVLWYHFFARFPHGAPVRGAWKGVLFGLYGFGIAAASVGMSHHAAFQLQGVAGAVGLIARHPVLFSLLGPVSFVAWCGAVVATFFVVRHNYRLLEDRDQRRRVRWVMLSASIAVVPAFAALVLVIVPPGPGPGAGLAVDAELLVHACSLAIPLSVAYAVVKHRVFDIRVVVRRGVQYLFALRALQLLVAAPVVAWVYTLIVNRDRTLSELVTESSEHFLWIIAAALALRFRRPIQRWLDRKFFREEVDRERVLAGLVDELGEADSISELSSVVLAKLEPALHPTSVFVWYRHPGELAAATASNPELALAGFPSGAAWLSWLEERGSGAEVPLPPAAGLSQAESQWLAARGVALAVPIPDSGHRLIGVLLLGGKKSEQPYTDGDARFLNAVAKQLGIVRENMRLKSRLSEELRVRHDVLARLDGRLPDLLKECPACGACFSGDVDRCAADGRTLTLSLPVARTIDERYRLDRLIGKGGMGAVYEARDLRLERTVAVKIMLSRAFGQPGGIRRFRREARAAARLSHPNIVTVYDVGSLEGEGAYIVMERIEGETLRAALDRERRLSPAAAARWFAPLLDGIAAAHARGIVHRDLKPENVMGHGHEPGPLAVKILDLGLVKLRAEEALVSGTVTVEGTVMGTPDYMPPEQLLGREVDHRSDIFAIGIMVLESLTGRRTLGVDLRAPKPSGADSHRLDPALQALLERCLAADPRDRPASAAALSRELLPLLLGQGLEQRF